MGLQKLKFLLISFVLGLLTGCGSGSSEGASSSGGTTSSTSTAATDATSTTSTSSTSVPADSSGVTSDIEIQAGTLTAGDIDDNLNFSAFSQLMNDLLQQDQKALYPNVNLSKRIILSFEDDNAKEASNVKVNFFDDEDNLTFSSYTNSAGILYLYPEFDNPEKDEEWKVTVENHSVLNNEQTNVLKFDVTSPSENVVEFEIEGLDSKLPERLQLQFVLDTTGSMSDELNYLTTEFTSIVERVSTKYPAVDIEFALTVYRDIGDDYVVQHHGFTSSVSEMQN